MTDWRPQSWRNKPATQQPTYEDPSEVQQVLEELAQLPPLVTSWEIENLRQQLAEASEGKRFLLQGGDCAEIFDGCQPAVVANKLKILLQMSLVLLHGGQRRVVRVGRFAGQYAKPRSDNNETRDGKTFPSYRGDLVNAIDFTAEKRRHNPHRMLRGHGRAALTLNFIRSLVDGGFADLHHPEYWDLSFVEHSPMADEYKRIVEGVGESLRFMETMSGQMAGEISRVDFFTSHEGLHLLYEEAHTREVPHRRGWYNLSTHFPWIGMRTANLDSAHVEYFRGISNPIAVKVGPSVRADTLLELIDILNPDNEPGRLTLIHRFGEAKIAEYLPKLLSTVRQDNRRVLWVCDPMHGNTFKTESGIKTRDFEHILSEVEQAFDIHADCGTRLGGIHVELTGDDVTECTGGARGLTEGDLGRSYETFVDPRLNYEQALELAMRVAKRMRAMARAAA